MHVFYLDDDIEDLTIFSEILSEFDPEIRCDLATDSSHALHSLKYGSLPDFIFLDFNMPLRSGEECLLLIRQMDHLKNVPIVIYSTGVNDVLKQRLLEGGAAMVIKKHGTTAELKSFFKSTFLRKPAGRV